MENKAKIAVKIIFPTSVESILRGVGGGAKGSIPPP